MTDTPQWLNVMRTLNGTKEAAGSADNPVIVGMADAIAHAFPEMASYCAQYQHDDTPWCGLTVAYCMAMSGIRPVFGPTDTDKFLWALAWADDPAFGTVLDSPRLGCVVVMEREGGGHVTLYENSTNGSYACRGGNQSDAVNVSNYSKSSIVALVWPKAAGPVPPEERRILEQGDSGADVAELQRILGLPVDGEFGSVTQGGVEGFQAAFGLDVDGVVGPATWAELDALDVRMLAGDDGLSDAMIDEIVQIAQDSELVDYQFKDRGQAPGGYIAGMALAFALAVTWHDGADPAALAMAVADRNDPDTDALTWYRSEFAAAGMSNAQSGLDTLRHLFVMLIGLGMRESSGRYCEGRDMSADNVSADTAEAGLFQTSWNIASADPNIPPLLTLYDDDPNGFLPAFAEDVTPNASELTNYGSGAGAKYQWLAKYSPAFAVMVTALGLRRRRQHWGPINRRECEILRSADELLQEVQELVADMPEPEPEPEPEPDAPEVDITVVASGKVKVTVNGIEMVA